MGGASIDRNKTLIPYFWESWEGLKKVGEVWEIFESFNLCLQVFYVFEWNRALFLFFQYPFCSHRHQSDALFHWHETYLLGYFIHLKLVINRISYFQDHRKSSWLCWFHKMVKWYFKILLNLILLAKVTFVLWLKL